MYLGKRDRILACTSRSLSRTQPTITTFFFFVGKRDRDARLHLEIALSHSAYYNDAEAERALKVCACVRPHTLLAQGLIDQ